MEGKVKEKEIFKIIYTMAQKHKDKLNIKWLCATAGVSRSGYYNYVKNLTSDKYLLREEKDREDFELILKAYQFKNRHKGARLIKMTLEHDFDTIMNLKKIRRLMRKFNLICPIRKANPYRRMAKAMATNNYYDNILNRDFYEAKPFEHLLTDITYIYYGPNKQKAYLSTIKDAATREILAYKLSTNLELDFVLDTVKQLNDRFGYLLSDRILLHSDQGFHYTSIAYQQLLNQLEITQSMSRRGNCWDNAPQESFFGHMKDELHIKECIDYEELQIEIDDYMDYYNNYRYQWDLGKRSPVEYRIYLLEGGNPLLHKKEANYESSQLASV